MPPTEVPLIGAQLRLIALNVADPNLTRCSVCSLIRFADDDDLDALALRIEAFTREIDVFSYRYDRTSDGRWIQAWHADAPSVLVEVLEFEDREAIFDFVNRNHAEVDLLSGPITRFLLMVSRQENSAQYAYVISSHLLLDRRSMNLIDGCVGSRFDDERILLNIRRSSTFTDICRFVERRYLDFVREMYNQEAPVRHPSNNVHPQLDFVSRRIVVSDETWSEVRRAAIQRWRVFPGQLMLALVINAISRSFPSNEVYVTIIQNGRFVNSAMQSLHTLGCLGHDWREARPLPRRQTLEASVEMALRVTAADQALSIIRSKYNSEYSYQKSPNVLDIAINYLEGQRTNRKYQVVDFDIDHEKRPNVLSNEEITIKVSKLEQGSILVRYNSAIVPTQDIEHFMVEIERSLQL